MNENIKKYQNYSKIYNFVMGVLYLLFFCCAGTFVLIAAGSDDTDAAANLFSFGIMAICTFPFMILHFLLGVSIEKRSKFIYYANIASMAIGVTSLLTAVPAVLILIEWTKPEIKKYYTE